MAGQRYRQTPKPPLPKRSGEGGQGATNPVAQGTGHPPNMRVGCERNQRPVAKVQRLGSGQDQGQTNSGSGIFLDCKLRHPKGDPNIGTHSKSKGEHMQCKKECPRFEGGRKDWGPCPILWGALRDTVQLTSKNKNTNCQLIVKVRTPIVL